MAYNLFCSTKNCKHYVEWEYTFDEEMPPYPCVSCKLVGQSHNIEKYPDSCPFINEIKIYEKEFHKFERLSKYKKYHKEA